MKPIMKKPVIYMMVGMMQIGLFASAAEAASLYTDSSQPIVQLARHDRDRHDRERYEHERRRHHDERLREENERHEKEMRRHPHESKREWRERQRREKERHERALRIITAILIGIAISSSDH